jgi:hypothetical protein
VKPREEQLHGAAEIIEANNNNAFGHDSSACISRSIWFAFGDSIFFEFRSLERFGITRKR